MEALPQRSVASSQTGFLESDEEETMSVSKSHASRRNDIDELPGLDFEAGGRIEGINEQDVGRKLAISLDHRQSVLSWLENLPYNHTSIDSQKRKTRPLSDHANRWKVLLAMIRFIVRSQMVSKMDILEAASQGSYNQVHTLLLRGVDIHFTDGSSETALSYAARNGHITTVELLLSKGADVNIINGGGETALTHAIRNGHTTIAELLLSHGADVNLKDRSGKTALTHAARNGHTTIAELLLSHGADVNLKDRSGKTALTHAVRNGHDVTVKLLLSYGASWSLARTPPVSGDDTVAFPDHYKPVTEEVQDNVISLRVGKIHGIYTGTQFVSALEPSITVEITEVDDYESKAKVIGGVFIGDSSKSLWLIPCRWSKAENLEVTLSPELGRVFHQKLVSEMNKRLIGQFSCFDGPQTVDEEDTERFLIHVQRDAAAIDICGQRWLFGNEGHLRDWKVNSQDFDEAVVDSAIALQHLFRFGQILKLQSKSEEAPPFNILITPDGNSPSTFKFQYNNFGEEQLCVVVFVLSSSFHVKQLYPTEDMPRGTAAGTSLTLKFLFKAPIPPGGSRISEQSEHRDIVRTIVIRGMGISMKSMEMPDIWGAGEWDEQAIAVSRNGEHVQDLHWWVHDRPIVFKA